MESNTIRSFAGGLIVAAVFLGGVYFMGPGEASSKVKEDNSKKTTELSVDEMKSKLAAEGYVIQTQEELDKQLSDATAKAEAEKPKEDANQNVVYRTVISVSQGMTSIDVGKALEQTQIIDNGFAFSQEVEKRGLSNQLKPGMFEVQSGMSVDEIIAAIFK